MAVMGRVLQIQTIRKRLIGMGHSPDVVNIDGMVDSRMDLDHNWNQVKGKLMYLPASKSRSALTHDRVKKVSPKTGPKKVSPPKPATQKPVAKATITQKPASSNAQMRNGTCMIPVAAYERRCSPKTAAKLSAGGHR